MARRKARRPAKSSEQRMERTWTGHRRAWLLVAAVAGKMPLRFSGRTGDPSPTGGSSGALLGSHTAPAENSARKSRATWSHPSSSSTSPTPQPSPWVKSEYTRRVTGPGVTWRRRRDLALSTKDMAGKTENPAPVGRPPGAPPYPGNSQSAAAVGGPDQRARHCGGRGARASGGRTIAGSSSGCAVGARARGPPPPTRAASLRPPLRSPATPAPRSARLGSAAP